MRLFRAKSRFRYLNIKTNNTQRLKYHVHEAGCRLADQLRAMAPRLPACYAEHHFPSRGAAGSGDPGALGLRLGMIRFAA